METTIMGYTGLLYLTISVANARKRSCYVICIQKSLEVRT